MDESAVTLTPAERPFTDYTPLKKRAIELREQKYSYRQIARQLKVSHVTVKNWIVDAVTCKADSLNIPVTPITRQDIQQRIFEAAPPALQTVIQLSGNSKRDEVRLNASRDLLDRAGFAPIARTLNISVVEEMSRDQLLAGLESLLQLSKAKDAPTINSELPINNRLTEDNNNMGNNQASPDAGITGQPTDPVHSVDTPREGGDAESTRSGGPPNATSAENASCTCNKEDREGGCKEPG